ncbi:ELKS/Rab6-interacting/CAST family member 1-like [Fopius arisanus]|uniref:ELKS/Rab6-interacting/CAST family member 1-like n=1 Tax=Fopius arisanus TaxID=64838 RepID=A0A9R1TM07_9HYME|nr:PREDICTED: ELKS/Rab6-interacting/CAST family member 1-like [Fopius arisanus]
MDARSFRDTSSLYSANNPNASHFVFLTIYFHCIVILFENLCVTCACKHHNTQQEYPSCRESTNGDAEDIRTNRIGQLEAQVLSLENFWRDHSDNEGITDLRNIIQMKSEKIESLEDTIAEFEDFLKENPDVKELRDLKARVTVGDRRIRELENWIERNTDVRIEKTRIIELEEMVTHLEEYVKSHNVDALKQQLQDREERIDQLSRKIESLEKDLLRRESLQIPDNRESFIENDDIQRTLGEKEMKIKEMEHAISEKDNRLQACEQEVIEWQDKVAKMTEEMKSMREELREYEAEDIGVLKEEIRVRDERVQQLEDEIDSLERAFGERIDLEQIEELLGVIKEKEEKENRLENDLKNAKQRNDELKEALKGSVKITSDSERRIKMTERARKNAFERVEKLEQRIASMQSASALKCHTCRPLLSRLSKLEKKLERLTDERIVQLKDLHHLKREALKAALSEKDAHLALLELSGIKNAAQADQAERLKMDKERLMERLKQEDKRCMELSQVDDESTSSDDSGESTPLLRRILEPTLAKEDLDCIRVLEGDNHESTSVSSRPLSTNGHGNGDGRLSKESGEHLEITVR